MEDEPAIDHPGICVVISDWHQSIVHGDRDGAVAAHTDGIVMFDVPPPERGVRGLAAHAGSSPQCFDWLASGGPCEVDELDIAAGDDVAFASALLRCGIADDLREGPTRRLRLTLGLRRLAAGWVIEHAHHSFTSP